MCLRDMKKHQYSLYVGGTTNQWDKGLAGSQHKPSTVFAFSTASFLLNNLFMARSHSKNRVRNAYSWAVKRRKGCFTPYCGNIIRFFWSSIKPLCYLCLEPSQMTFLIFRSVELQKYNYVKSTKVCN